VKKIRDVPIVPADPTIVIWLGVIFHLIKARAVGWTTRFIGARRKELIMVVTS
jgi:hypothetical protein